MATKKLQSKLFGKSGINGGGKDNASPTSAQSTIDPNLKINIPKPPSLNTSDGKDDRKVGKGSNWRPDGKQSYKQYLLNKLGTRYDGVEVYRLEQDEKRERHWKRWGPYLAERQWVSLP